jgi:ArsR family transcriptional regulator, arsenate/arsenite/antimonite-responsive transcriptional repressor
MKSQRAPTPSTPTDATRAVAALAALAQETRLAIFRLLIEYTPDGLTAGAIALQLKLPPATLSFHLKELANAGLILDRRESRFIWYRANVAGMNGLLGYLTENCCRASGSVACDSECAPAASCKPSTPRTRSQR